MIYFSLIYLCSDIFFTSQQSLNENININNTGRCDYAGVDIIQMRKYYRDDWSDNNWDVSYSASIEMHSCGSFVYTRWPFTSSINICSTFYAFILFQWGCQILQILGWVLPTKTSSPPISALCCQMLHLVLYHFLNLTLLFHLTLMLPSVAYSLGILICIPVTFFPYEIYVQQPGMCMKSH